MDVDDSYWRLLVNQGEMMTNINTQLLAAQGEFGPLVKGSTNPHYKSKYADLADLVEAVRPPLHKHGVAFYHSMTSQGDVHLMGTILVHAESGTKIECWVPLIVAKPDMQAFKSATTYAKRIGLESVTGIAPEDDDGNAAAKAAPRNQNNPRPDTSKVDQAEVDKWVKAIADILDTDADEYEHAEAIRSIHNGLRTRTEMYVCVADKLAADKILSKAELRKFINLKREAA